MSTHYCLMIEKPDANLSAGTGLLNSVYTQLTNRAHRRVGHVFQSRFKVILVNKDNYLLELARYVVLNPVRADTVQDPAQCTWSSYAAMLVPGCMPGVDWLVTDKLLACFAPDQQSFGREKAQQRYVNHVREGIGLPFVWEDLSGQVYLGDEKFVNKMSATAEQNPQGADAERSRLEIPHAQRRPAPLPFQNYIEIQANNRNAAIQAAFATGNYTMAQLAVHFKLHYTSVRPIVKLA